MIPADQILIVVRPMWSCCVLCWMPESKEVLIKSNLPSWSWQFHVIPSVVEGDLDVSPLVTLGRNDEINQRFFIEGTH